MRNGARYPSAGYATRSGTIYIGVTNDLGRRMPEHKSGNGSRFTSRYGSGPQERCRQATIG
jgi:putative endonuclease